MAKLEEQLNEQVLNGTVPVNDQNLQQALIETAVLDDLIDVAIPYSTNNTGFASGGAGAAINSANNLQSGSAGAHNHTISGATANATATNQNTGGGGAHNNLQPYITVYFFKRTA